MARFFMRISGSVQRKWTIIILALFWCTGLICGVKSNSCAGDTISSLMRMAADRPVSIVNLLTVSLLPFLFSAFAVYLHSRTLLLTVCFIKAWLFGLISAGCYQAFGNAGWLVWLMICFSDIGCLIPLWWFWITHCDGIEGVQIHRLAGCFTAVLTVVGLDYGFISPFLVRLIEI